MSLEKVAKHLASKGRDEDTMLVHMTPREVHGLQALAKAHGGSLTTNPDTGLPEAGFLKSILPTLVGVGLNMFAPGLGTAATMAIGAGVGALSNRQDPLMGALMGGMGAYGGASLGSSISSGLSAAAAPAATNVALPAAASTPAAFNAPIMGNWTPVNEVAKAAAAAPSAVQPMFVESIEAAIQKPDVFLKNAGGIGSLAKSGMLAAAPLMMMQPESGSRSRTSSEPIRYEYDAGYVDSGPSSNFTAERRYFNPTYRRMAEGGEVTTKPPEFVSQSTTPTFVAQPQQQLSYNPVVPQAQPQFQQAQPQFQQPQVTSGIAGLQNIPTQYGTTLPSNVEDQRIRDYVTDVVNYRQGLTDAQRGEEIDRTAQQFGVTREQLAKATGYDLNTVNNYLGYMRPDIAPTGNMRGASADAMKYLYGVPNKSTGEAVSQPVTTIGAVEGSNNKATNGSGTTDYSGGISGYEWKIPGGGNGVMSLSFTPEQVAAGGKYVIYDGVGDSGPQSAWVPAPKQTTPTTTDAEIKNYVQSILGDQSLSQAQRAAAINAKAKEYGVNRSRLAAATGYSAKEIDDYLGKAYAAGGGLRSGGFVVPADVVSALGNGSTDAGLEVLMKKFNAKPIDGPGDGMSDSIPTTIEGKQKALVARGEAYISPEDVARFGGSKKFYAMLDKIRHNAHGKKTQQRKVNPEKVV